MRVLLVEETPELGGLWKNHLKLLGMDTSLVTNGEAALHKLRNYHPDIIVANLDLPDAGAISVADYAAYRYPETQVIFVTSSTFFSDGSIFAMSPNACAFLSAHTPPEDLAAVIEYHAERRIRER
ncbi:MAG: response regulator [Maritimibacter sp.]|jgi:DNA-binding response OmpR family regulator